MDKPASVILQLSKQNDGFWMAMVNTAEQKTVSEVGDEVYVLLPVKSYSMDDHQFIQIRIALSKRGVVLVCIPRGIVKTVVEGKTDLREAFSFAGSKIK